MRLLSFIAVASGLGLVACGLAPSTSLSSGHESSASRAGPAADSPIPTASGWLVYANKAGQFTFSAPAAWQIQSCEDLGGYALAAHSGPPPCGRFEYNDAWFVAQSPNGDQRETMPPNTNNSFSAGTLTSTSAAKVDGVGGNRYTALVESDLPMPPPKGTTQIYYIFFNGTRTYAFVYDHFPTDPDRSTDFDRLVQQTLLFRA